MIKNIRGSLKHVFAVLLFCFVMSMAMVCLADEQGTVTVESAKIRASADTSSEQLGSVAQGKTVDIIGETTGTDGKVWYQVYVDANTKGYIRSDLIKKNGSSSSAGSSSGTTTSASQTTTVTDIEAKTGTVVTNSVRVRKSASTDSAEIATVSRGILVTVTGETTGTDGKKWYKVSFKYSDKNIEGFIRADLVTFENVPADTAVSEITGEESVEGQTETETEPETQEPQKQESSPDTDENAGIILMNVEEVPYIMPGFELVSLDWNGQKINAYRNGTFFIFYAQKQNGEEGWYMLDREEGIYQRYPYTVEGATIPETNSLTGNLVPIIVLVVIIAIMVLIIVLLLVKLKGNSDGYERYDEDDDYADEDDDIEDIEELEDEPEEEPVPQPVRRPTPKNGGQQPVRRPAPQNGGSQGQRPVSGGQQPVRRPAPQNGAPQGQQPVRRPASQNGAPQGQNSQQPRRPVPQGQQPVRRPASQNGAPQGQRRPNPQNNRPAQNVQPQKGQRAKNFLESDEDDMDFIDI